MFSYFGRLWGRPVPTNQEERQQYLQEYGVEYSLQPEDIPVKFRGGILGPRARKHPAQKSRPLWETGGVRKRRTSRKKF